jgi:hypothetical protein
MGRDMGKIGKLEEGEKSGVREKDTEKLVLLLIVLKSTTEICLSVVALKICFYC